MLITKRTYKKKYVIGGAGIFGSIGNFFARMLSSNAAKQLARVALQAGKIAAKDIGMKAIDMGKTVVIDTVKILVEKAAKRLSTPKSQVANVLVAPEEITKKANEVIASNAIAIQDLVRRINGSGLKVTYIIFLLLLKIMADIFKFTDSQ